MAEEYILKNAARYITLHHTFFFFSISPGYTKKEMQFMCSIKTFESRILHLPLKPRIFVDINFTWLVKAGLVKDMTKFDRVLPKSWGYFQLSETV